MAAIAADMTDCIIALTTWPDEAGAQAFAHHLLQNRLAACVNTLPAMTSHYVWQGQVNTETEHQLVIKTSVARQGDIETALRQQHPYELAEFLILPVSSGSRAFLQWINETTHVD
ncbi:unnamed protein product [Cyprideis torosa]|uniref:Uncharacterized protein n=1 Tax=Cyprideis torosa TaxID=163714 RepID=A0A7R8X270_9CRUS|nr:unnamed protein product [Cyprideis torosa]CAG0911672.1 unnamed protein product [Cyprideis torosa]